VHKTFLELVRDETPMVRRAAMIALGPLAKAMGSAHVAGDEEMLSAFVALSEDQQDSVRLFAIDSCVDLAGVLPTALSKERVLPRALKLAKDASWRVRWSVANKFVALCGAAGDPEPGDALLDVHELLLQDSEMEVRTVAAVTVAEMAKKMSPSRARTQLLPLVAKLVSDECEHVRIAVASVIMALGATVSQMGDSSLLMSEMVPLYLELLKDPKSDVRLNIIAKVSLLCTVTFYANLAHSLTRSP
jgi:serine/threonine-protein phosphatase 2A regulatory subunit A